jgi:hypothetical protein
MWLVMMNVLVYINLFIGGFFEGSTISRNKIKRIKLMTELVTLILGMV